MNLKDMSLENLQHEYSAGRYDILNFNNSLGMTKEALINYVNEVEQEIFVREQEQYNNAFKQYWKGNI